MEFSIWLDLRPRPGVAMTARDFDETVQLVQAAERLGFSGVWTTEQHGVDDGYLPSQLPVLAAFARETTTLRLGTGVILLPLTHPRRVVEEACVVDVISNGRLTLGLGAGNYPNEFRIFGVPHADRGRLMESGAAFVKAGLSGGLLPDGSWVNIPPVQRPIPLVLGGLVGAAIDRAVRLADGHFAYAYESPDDDLVAMYERFTRPALERHGRSPSGFRMLFGSILWQSDDAEREWKEVVGPAFAYTQRKYADWEEGVSTAGGYAFSGDLDHIGRQLFVGRADDLAQRLVSLRDRYPFSEIVFWARLPGVPLSLAIEHLERLSAGLLTLIGERHAPLVMQNE